MKFLPLIWKNLWRRKMRTVFTLACVFVAFLLFGMLMTIRAAFSFGVDLAGIDRLIVIHKVSLIQLLPESYHDRIRSVDGVEAVTHNTWFGGIYRDPSDFFAQFATEPDVYLSMYPEFRLSPEAMKTWLADRQGAVVGRATADRFGWNVGDRVALRSPIWPSKSGDGTWEFNIAGIYEGDPGVDTTNFLFRYDYFDENRQQGQGLIGWYVVKIADPSRSVEMAQRFDDMFANSSAETKTTTEKGFVEGFAKQIGDIGSIMVAILSAVLFTMLLVVANTMAQAVRERTSELAVLKTLGFSNRSVVGIVLVESVAIAVVGGALGLGLAWLIVQQGDPTNGLLPIFALPGRDLVTGAWLMAALGLLAGALPAAQAMRLRIVDALRRN